MKPSESTGSKLNEDTKTFVDEVQKIFQMMPVGDTVSVELASYHLKDVSRIWFDQWKKITGKNVTPLGWAIFEYAFLGHFFSKELREAKPREFLNLEQGSMSIQEYNVKFTQLSCYAPMMVANMRDRMSLLVFGLSCLLNKQG